MSSAKVGLRASVLVVEDDSDLREALVDTLELAGCEVRQAPNAEAALQILASCYLDLVVSDLNMPGMDGLQLLRQVRSQYPQLPMLIITAFGSINSSVEAMRLGAVDYLVKPFAPALLVETVARHVAAVGAGDAQEPVASEPCSQQLLQLARRVAQTDSTVLICGESGTGKEVLARYIHRHSRRADQPFVAINCAAIPENMLEAMLFGHEKGAFTGAYTSAPGKFELANGGSLLLDEISEMAMSLQAKLLRVIQEREVERLGGRKPIALDVRLLATTNRQLEQAVAEGRFREDLYYRLSVFPLQWRPLRERPHDIVPIAQRLLHQHLARMGRAPVVLDATAIEALQRHRWPGNVRELDNVMQRALILQMGSTISAADLLIHPFGNEGAVFAPPSTLEFAVVTGGLSRAESALPDNNRLEGDLQRREFEIILDTLRGLGGSRKNTAEKLGISPRTLRYKLAQMRDTGIDIDSLLTGT